MYAICEQTQWHKTTSSVGVGDVTEVNARNAARFFVRLWGFVNQAISDIAVAVKIILSINLSPEWLLYYCFTYLYQFEHQNIFSRGHCTSRMYNKDIRGVQTIIAKTYKKKNYPICRGVHQATCLWVRLFSYVYDDVHLYSTIAIYCTTRNTKP